MKKTIILIPLVAVAMAFSSFANADRYNGGHGHHGHHGHHRHHDRGGYSYQGPNYYQQQRIYYPAPPVVQTFVPQPQVNYYVAPPPPPQIFYRPAEHRNRYDPRSHQGLAGGVVGSVLGYEMGRGDPVATGLGAAAGAFVGNRW